MVWQFLFWQHFCHIFSILLSTSLSVCRLQSTHRQKKTLLNWFLIHQSWGNILADSWFQCLFAESLEGVYSFYKLWFPMLIICMPEHRLRFGILGLCPNDFRATSTASIASHTVVPEESLTKLQSSTMCSR